MWEATSEGSFHHACHLTTRVAMPAELGVFSDSSVKELENQHYTLPAATDTIQQAVTNLNFEVSLEAMKGASDRKIRNQPLGTGIRTRPQTQPQHIFCPTAGTVGGTCRGDTEATCPAGS